MPSPAAVLNILVTANSSQATASLAKTQAQLNATAATANKSTAAVAKSSGKWGAAMKTAAKTGGLAMAAAGAIGIKMAVDFEDAMIQISTQAGASMKEVEKMKQPILDLARSAEFGPVELAKGLFRVESAGYRGAKAMRILKSATDLADVGHANLEQTTRAYVAAIRSGIKGTKDYNRAAGLMNAIVGQGSMRMEDLVSAFGTGLLPRAKAVGVGLDEVGAALGVLTEQGMGASQAATRLGMTFSFMVRKPTTDAAAAMDQLNIKQGLMAKMLLEPNGLLKVLSLLHDRLAKVPEAQRAALLGQMFGGGRSGAAIQILLNSLDQYEKKLGSVRQQAGDFSKKIAEDNLTLASKVALAMSFMQSVLTQAGLAINSVLNAMILAIPKVIQAFSAMGQWIGRAASNMVGFVKSLYPVKAALVVVGAAIMLLAPQVKAVAGLFRATLGGGIRVVIAILKDMGRMFGNVVGIISNLLRGNFAGAWRNAKELVVDHVHGIINVVKSIIGAIKGVAGPIKDVLIAPFRGAFNAIKGFINAIIDVINTVLGPVGVHIGAVGTAAAKGAAGTKTSGSKGSVATGRVPGRGRQLGGLAGVVPGSGIGDKVLMQAMVEPQEGVFIMNKNAMGVLRAFNDHVPRFARGGLSSVTPGKRGAVTSNVGPNIAGALGGFNLPGVGGLPQWIQPAGEFVLAKVGEYIKKKLASVVTGVGGDLLMRNHPGLQPGIAGIANTIMSRNKGLSVSSATRPGDSGSFHSLGRAIDLSGSPEAMYRAAGWISKHMTPLLTEGIHNPNLSVDTGRRVPPSFWGAATWAQHLSHIHLAKQRGGQIFGNRLSKDQLTTLAAYVGMSNPARMAAIAMAESGGNPRSTGGAGERGLWQILGSTAASFGLPWGKMYDPIKNARGAAKILKGQGLGAWTTYTSGAYKRFLGGQVKPGLLARLRGGAGAAGTTAKVAKETTYGLLGTIDREALLESMQAAVEAENARRGTINELQAAQNLLALQRYQTGAAQNPFLGIPSPAMPALAQMLGMAPNAFLHAPPEAPVRSGTMRKGYGFGAGIVGQAQPPPVHVHIHAKKGAPDFTSWLDVQIEKKQKKAARLGRRRLPSAGAR